MNHSPAHAAWFLAGLVFAPATTAQQPQRCVTDEVHQAQIQAHPELQIMYDAAQREMAEWIEDHPNGSNNRAVVTIPIVFHVINNGEAVGTGTNISSTYINAQLDQLNDDFRALNSDIGNVPGTFSSDVGDPEIEFCLATQDENGNSTTGIIRWDRNAQGWNAPPYGTGYINSTIKPATIWDRDDYLNFWIINLSGGLLGYAQFPGGNANTDGVVCLYTSVGSLAVPYPGASPYDHGRTGTHEVGHWLNLCHMWACGGSGCGNDDGVGDTPTSSSPYFGCPSHPQTTCSSTDMFMNFMDYVDDNCMIMFSDGQATRVQSCINTTRVSLQSSSGCQSLLPVQIVEQLEARYSDQLGCELTWATSHERESSHYTIERSNDAMVFESIGQVESVGASAREARYTFYDETPIPGLNYYRFKQYDQDGQHMQSRIVSVRVPYGIVPTMSVAPNPAATSVTLMTAGLELPATCFVTDGFGRLMHLAEITKESTEINLQSLAAGVYTIRIRSADHSTLVERLIVQ